MCIDSCRIWSKIVNTNKVKPLPWGHILCIKWIKSHIRVMLDAEATTVMCPQPNWKGTIPNINVSYGYK